MTKRKTMGFPIDWTDSDYHLKILSGVASVAEEHDANLYCF